jgi:hypothetical protein
MSPAIRIPADPDVALDLPTAEPPLAQAHSEHSRRWWKRATRTMRRWIDTEQPPVAP